MKIKIKKRDKKITIKRDESEFYFKRPAPQKLNAMLGGAQVSSKGISLNTGQLASLFDALLTGWKGVEDEDGNEIRYSQDNALSVDFNDKWQIGSELYSELSGVDEEEEEDLKKSDSPTDSIPDA